MWSHSEYMCSEEEGAQIPNNNSNAKIMQKLLSEKKIVYKKETKGNKSIG